MTPSSAGLPLASFVNELAVAYKKLSFYPEGHPAREKAVDTALGMLRALAAPTGELAVGVAREELVVSDEHLTSDGARGLAQALYRKSVAVVRFEEAVTAADLEAFLLSVRPSPDVEDERLGSVLRDRGVATIRIEDVDYTAVTATADLAATRAPQVSLWQRILRLKLEGKPLASEGEHGAASLELVIEILTRRLPGAFAPGADGAPAEAAVLAQQLAEAIEAQLAETGVGPDSPFVLKQIADLLEAVPEGLRGLILEAALERLTAHGADPGRLEAVIASGSAADLVSALRRLRDRGHHFSPHAAAIIERLVLEAAPESHASPGPGAEHLEALLADDEAHPLTAVDEAALRLPKAKAGAISSPPEFEESFESLAPGAVMGSLLSALLALLDQPDLGSEQAESVGRRLAGQFENLVRSDRLTAAAALAQHLADVAAERAAKPAGRAAREVHDALTGATSIPLLLEAFQNARGGDTGPVRHLVAALGRRFIRHALVALSEADERKTRRDLFDFLRSFPESVVGDATALLADRRWFVVRNMVALLAAVDDRSSIPEVRRCLAHEDSRVRLEAAKSLARLDAELPPEHVQQAIDRGDLRVAEVLVRAAGSAGGTDAVEPLLAILKPLDSAGHQSALRIHALESLGEIGDPAALPQLARYFRRWFPVDKVEVRRAAFASLAGYPPADRARWVRRGRRSRDAEIRQVCRNLAEEAQGD